MKPVPKKVSILMISRALLIQAYSQNYGLSLLVKTDLFCSLCLNQFALLAFIIKDNNTIARAVTFIESLDTIPCGEYN